MVRKYIVQTFVGDYSLPDQPCWGTEYVSQIRAIQDAVEQQESMLRSYPNCYSIVMGYDALADCDFLIDASGNHFYGDAATSKANQLVERDIESL